MKEQFWFFGKRSHWLEDKGTYNLMFYIYSGNFLMFQTKISQFFVGAFFSRQSDIVTRKFLKISPKHWYYLRFLNKRSYFISTIKFYINRESMNLHFQEGYMTCILTAWYRFPCIKKQKKSEYGILTFSFIVTKL